MSIGFHALRGAISDLRYGARVLARQKKLSALVVVTVGLAIGANVSIFQVLNLTMLRALPFADAGRLCRVLAMVARPNAAPARGALSPQAFARVRDSGIFERVVAQRVTNLVLRTEAEPERVVGIDVSSGWTPLFGIRPALGRPFAADEERRGAGAGVAIISDALWQRAFQRDPAVLGRTVLLDDRSTSIIGVMPPAFNYPYHADVWLPMSLDESAGAPANLNVVGRLAASATPAATSARLRDLTTELIAGDPTSNTGRTLEAIPLRTDLLENGDVIVLALFGAVAFVLLIAAANVSSLLLTRAMARRRDMAVRAALGATRLQRFRAMACESLVLAAAGGVFGALVALWAHSTSSVLLPKDLRELGVPPTADARVIGFMFAITAFAGCVIGLLPAWRFSRVDINGALRGGRSTSSPGDRRLLGGVVVAEIAVALVLLVGATQMLDFLRAVNRADPGFDARGVLTLRVPLSPTRLPSADSRVAFVRRILDELGAIPGVSAAGVTSFLPLGTTNQATVVSTDAARDDRVPMSANHRVVDGRYFRAIGLTLVAGRTFDDRDRAGGEPTAVVSRALADELWPKQEALGQRVKRGPRDAAAPWLTVVGVVNNTREQREATAETMYVPYTQQVASFTGSVQPTFVLRTATDFGELALSARRAVARVDAGSPVFQVATIDEIQSIAYAQERLGTQTVGVFAAAGLVLVILGVYGLTAYAVAQRMREMAIRRTFGAAVSHIVWLVVRQSGVLAMTGIVAGGVSAVVLSRVLRGLVPGLQAAPSGAFLFPALALALLTLIAAGLPAWRVTRIDPIVALRQD
jgi:putative ABC transport system permease protein